MVRSNTHRPRREIERNVNMVMAVMGREVKGSARAKTRERRLIGESVDWEDLQYQIARTTGTYWG